MQKSLIIFVFCAYISVSFQIPFAPINRVCGAYDIKPLNSFKILSYLFVRNCDHFCLNQNLALDPANIYLFKVNNKNTRKRCEICSKLTIKTPERRQWRRSGVFIVNFEHISHLVLVFLLLTSNKLMLAGILPKTKDKGFFCKQK